jgi:hypothetical protein
MQILPKSLHFHLLSCVRKLKPTAKFTLFSQ